MPASALVIAVRANDAATVEDLLADPSIDVNEYCEVEPIVLVKHETPLYCTLPLLEAVRQRNKEIIRLLASRQDIDMNLGATQLQSSAFTDAVARGDIEMVEYLLEYPAVDPTQGNLVVAHPAQYAAMVGNTELLAMFGRQGLLTDAIEVTLLRTAAANNCPEAYHWLQNWYIDSRPMGVLTPGQQMVKIRRVFRQFDQDGNGFVDHGELKSLLAGLALPLFDDELSEAFLALNTQGDNRIDLDELTAYLLGSQRYKAALLELYKTGGYGGMQVDAAVEAGKAAESAAQGGQQ